MAAKKTSGKKSLDLKIKSNKVISKKGAGKSSRAAKPPAYRVIGTRPIRHDGTDKVTGRALYGADIQLTGMLHGKVLRSPHAHARIRSIRTEKALALPGVKAVLTASDLGDSTDRLVDLGEGETRLQYLRDNILASGKVLYRGHAVAAVAASSPHIAQEALQCIEVEYEVLPPVLDVLKAMEPGAPLLHEDLHGDDLGTKAAKPGNLSNHMRFEKGDIAKGFKAADKVFEGEYTTSMVHQGYIEPHSATAFWNADGRVTIWCSTQGAFTVRQQVAAVLDVPLSTIKVVPMEIGGGFGGKIPVYLEPVAALLSKKTGKPVKLTMDRSEVFESTGPTPGSHMRVKIGARKNGRIVAAEADLYYESGAFPGGFVACGMMCIFAPYDIEHQRIDGYNILVNRPKVAPYRAPGATGASFAAESVIDEIARWAGIDPLECRKLNAAKEGTRRADGLVYPRIGYLETVEAARSHPHYRAKLVGPNRGRGVASGFWFNIGLKSSVTASVNTDGTVSLIEGSTDIGGTRTSIAMQLAEVLGIAAEDVRPQVADTDSVGYTDVTGGSRTTFATGLVAIEAARDIERQMIERAAKLWEVAPAKVKAEGGVYSSSARKRISFKDLAAKLDSLGGPVVGRASMDTSASVGGGFGTHIVDVEIDPDTGKVTILRYTAVQDVGKAIHPSYVEGQLQGGVAQGIGWALNEEYFYDAQGRMANASFLDYRMPTALDLPMIDTVLVEVPNPGHPFGVRGVGEVPIVPPPAALANAIRGAAGVRLSRLPMNPGKVLEAILTKAGRPPAV